jgi:UDPglucose 6-dehydrogenase
MAFSRRRTKSRRVCVIGCGKLGLPLIAVLADAGHSVVGFDLNVSLIDQLSSGNVPWFEQSLQELIHKNQKRIQFIHDLANSPRDMDFYLVIVPSPSNNEGVFESKFVEEAINSIMSLNSQESQGPIHIVIVSTLMPGSTDQIFERMKTKFPDAARRFKIIYSPEFIALGSVVKDMRNPDLVLIGADDDEAADLYRNLVSSYIHSKPTFARLVPIEAEIAKIAVNSFVTTKISFANFISELCDGSDGASASNVLASIGADSRIGRSYLKPGAPFGGPCFPRDNIALSRFSESIGVDASIAKSTHDVNKRQTERIARYIEQYGKHNRVLIVGVAYKPGTAVIDESPSLYLAERLRAKFSVSLLDDYVGDTNLASGLSLMSSDEIESEPVCAVFMVPDSKYLRLPMILHRESVIIDLWGNLKPDLSKHSLIYYCIGEALEER